MMHIQVREAHATHGVREAARQLLAAFREHNPARQGELLPLDTLVAWLDLDVATFSPGDHPEGTFGFLDPQERLIWLCRDLPAALYRFTLAHELGHAILHRQATPIEQGSQQEHAATRDDPCQEEDVRESVSSPIEQQSVEDMLGPGLSDTDYDPRSRRELDANLFAAELLMPLEQVRARYLSRDIPPAKLADLFGVSPAAMLNRLSELVIGDVTTRDPGDHKGPPPTSAQPSPLRERGERRQYDRYQQAAIEARTPALIVAGPGSGKTSTLIGRAEYLIHKQGVEPQCLLALTFSRKAAQEMQERLQQALAPITADHLEQAALFAEFPTVSTFHAFCAGLLREYGSLVGLRSDFAFIDDAEGYFLLRRLGARLPLRHYQNLVNPAASFPAILSAISRGKDELTTPEMYAQLARAMLDGAQAMQETGGKQYEEELERAEKALEIAEMYALYQRQLELQGDTDFGGLIMLAVQLLRDFPDVRLEVQERYQHILVDEFQDINRASGVLLRLLAGDAQRVWVVGDANQAIYGFRGASPANIANFRDDYPDAEILPLSRNYRSRPDIVAIAESFRHSRLEPDLDAISAESARPGHADAYITLASAPDQASELHGLVEDMRHKHAQGYAYRDIVVLCRTRALARTVTRALVEAGLPVIERGGMLEQVHIRALLSTIMLLSDSGSMGILRAARQPDHPFSQADIEALLAATREEHPGEIHISLRQIFLSGHAPPGLSREGQRSFVKLSAILKSLYFPPAITSIWQLLAQYLFIESSIGRQLLSSDVVGTETDALRADYADLLALARFFDAQALRQREQREEAAGLLDTPGATDAPPIAEQVRAFLDYLAVLLTLRQDGGGSRREAGEQDGATPDMIRVMTVHASKGLEFPVVYLPGVVNQKFPAQRRWQPTPPPRGMIAAGDDEAAAHETGEACLFYVAATRARDHLIISFAERHGKRASKPSSYIHALAADLSDERIARVTWPKVTREETLSSQAGDVDTAEDQPDGSLSSQPGEAFLAASTPSTLRISAIETYQRCPRQYLYGSIYRFRGEAAAYQLFRRATQQTLDGLQKRIEAAGASDYSEQGERVEARYPTIDEARELYSQHWRAADGHTTPFAPLYEQHGHEVAELLRRKLLASGSSGWQLSPTYTVDVAGQPIEVTIDRVESPASGGVGEPPRFVKIGYGLRKTKVDPTARELLYARAYRQHHPDQPIALHFHNMSTGETFEIKLTQKKEQSLYQELEKALGGLARHEYPPKPDMQVCPGCAFFLICPA